MKAFRILIVDDDLMIREMLELSWPGSAIRSCRPGMAVKQTG
ncbi:MAG: hypothetical protein PHY09_03755 [Desulfuromonadaceae bacterium]|nr:hypothetical protein [Desulfuromonadaceae bacterium]MDD5104135.1 hypothetical protein [Desulfuromonadaceae bacterium]